MKISLSLFLKISLLITSVDNVVNFKKGSFSYGMRDFIGEWIEDGCDDSQESE